MIIDLEALNLLKLIDTIATKSYNVAIPLDEAEEWDDNTIVYANEQNPDGSFKIVKSIGWSLENGKKIALYGNEPCIQSIGYEPEYDDVLIRFKDTDNYVMIYAGEWSIQQPPKALQKRKTDIKIDYYDICKILDKVTRAVKLYLEDNTGDDNTVNLMEVEDALVPFLDNVKYGICESAPEARLF